MTASTDPGPVYRDIRDYLVEPLSSYFDDGVVREPQELARCHGND
jgi:hypothetical protein